MTYGTIYKFYEQGINIQSDINKIFKVFEEKSRIIDQHKKNEIEIYKNELSQRPKTAFQRPISKIFKQNYVIKELDDTSESSSINPKGPIFQNMENIDEEAAFCYNNILDSSIPVKTLNAFNFRKNLHRMPSTKSKSNSSQKSHNRGYSYSGSRSNSAAPRKISRATPILKGLEMK
mmetsp:Transcript_20966/g.18592  ORF Transcript_20966/g.18592 Transcript_20966/m.18592 type:complete len:176 (-) Transcript_20966:24-551(-)